MSNRVLDFIKSHPIGVAVGVAAIGGLYVVLHNSGSGGQTTDATAAYDAEQASEVAAGQQFQTAQLQANQAALVSNNQAAVANNQITGAEVIAGLQSQDTLAGISAQSTTQQNADLLSAQTTQAISLLQAQVAENQTAAQVQIDQINANALTTVAIAPYTSATNIAQIQANTTDQANQDATDVALAQIAASAQPATTAAPAAASGVPFTFAQYGTAQSGNFSSLPQASQVHGYEVYLNKFNATNGTGFLLSQEGTPGFTA